MFGCELQSCPHRGDGDTVTWIETGSDGSLDERQKVKSVENVPVVVLAFPLVEPSDYLVAREACHLEDVVRVAPGLTLVVVCGNGDAQQPGWGEERRQIVGSGRLDGHADLLGQRGFDDGIKGGRRRLGGADRFSGHV